MGRLRGKPASSGAGRRRPLRILHAFEHPSEWGDPREVLTDPHAQYFGAEVLERSLVPEDGATLGQIRYRDWAGRNATGK